MRQKRKLVRAAMFRHTQAMQQASIESTKSWPKRHEGTIKLLFALLGIIIGINEYLQRQHDSRVQRSLDIYERYQSKDVLEARLGIDRLWNNQEFWQELTKRHETNGRLYYDTMGDLVAEIVKDRDAIDDLYVVWVISSEASLCLSRGQCDQVTICQSFWHDTQKYYSFFEPYFDARKKAWDETVQNREGLTNTTLEEYCGNMKYMKIYATCTVKDGRLCGVSRYVRRYLHEVFNNPVGV